MSLSDANSLLVYYSDYSQGATNPQERCKILLGHKHTHSKVMDPICTECILYYAFILAFIYAQKYPYSTV